MILTCAHVSPLHEEPHDYFRYTPHGLKSLCREVGLLPVEVQPMGGAWMAIGYLLQHVLYPAGTKKSKLAVWWATRAFHWGAWLDRRHPRPDCPVNYLLVARKP